jgi:hypothetical protein|uniref:Uncharacterized protein n=1 Tax=Zea mays TaxID=4577 RepID=A0A804M6G2_MAIZE
MHQTLKFLPSKVWPNCQVLGAAFQEVEVRRSLAVTRKESAWPTRMALDCQFWPQFLDMGSHPVLAALTLARTTSPAPATFVISTRLKYRKPLMVNRTPPDLRHGTLQRQRQRRDELLVILLLPVKHYGWYCHYYYNTSRSLILRTTIRLGQNGRCHVPVRAGVCLPVCPPTAKV